jgi:hypothetical protein
VNFECVIGDAKKSGAIKNVTVLKLYGTHLLKKLGTKINTVLNLNGTHFP